jgi:arylformamidase
MNKWIDLTILLDKNYLQYPGDVPFKVEEERVFSKDNFNMKRITTNMHIGTHIDAPKHVLDLGEGIESIDINQVIGKAIVLEPRITNGVINTLDIINQYDTDYKIVIIKTNHTEYLNTDKYYDYPAFNRDVLNFLIKNNIDVIAFDMPSPKYVDEELLEMHKDLLSRNILIVENLTNLSKLDKCVDFIALPLKIQGFDGSLIRCVAKNIEFD